MGILIGAIEIYPLRRGREDGRQYSSRGWSVGALLPAAMCIVMIVVKYSENVVLFILVRALELIINSILLKCSTAGCIITS